MVYQIAIDGPAGSGKSTVAKILAQKLSYVYVDTGAMYRCVTLAAKKRGIAYSDESAISELVHQIAIEFIPADPVQKVILDNEDVTFDIRSEEVTNNVSLVSSYKQVREVLTAMQRQIANDNSVIMDGRDIGTTVLPNADLKIFLVASVQERAQRRYKELVAKGVQIDFEQLKEEIEIRDYKDSHREISPLKQAKDAILLDTTGLTIDEVTENILKIKK